MADLQASSVHQHKCNFGHTDPWPQGGLWKLLLHLQENKEEGKGSLWGWQLIILLLWSCFFYQQPGSGIHPQWKQAPKHRYKDPQIIWKNQVKLWIRKSSINNHNSWRKGWRGCLWFIFTRTACDFHYQQVCFFCTRNFNDIWAILLKKKAELNTGAYSIRSNACIQ